MELIAVFNDKNESQFTASPARDFPMGSQRVDDRERWFRENLLGTQS
jgi:hypothetical protein